MNKELISKRFAKSLKTYNQNAQIQKLMAQKMVGLLDIFSFNKILEIGCGTGLLTQELVKRIKFEKYCANDIVNDCENYIKEINSNIEFIGEDIEIYIEKSSQYDLIISNASLQWVEDFETFVKRLYDKLNPSGVLLISIFGNKNFKEIYDTTGDSLKYYSKLELHKMFNKFNLYIEEDVQILKFNTPKDVLKHLQYTGVNSLKEVQWTKGDMFKFEAEFLKRCNSAPQLTYNPIYLKILKK